MGNPNQTRHLDGHHGKMTHATTKDKLTYMNKIGVEMQ